MLENLKSKISGIPVPDRYNQYYITKYSFPKGLAAVKGIRRNARTASQKNAKFDLKRKKNGTYYLKSKHKRK